MTQLLSVIVPVFNEEETLPVFHRRLKAALTEIDIDAEVVYVDDGSLDGSLAWMQTTAADDRSVRAVGLSRNFGHQIAVTAGLDVAVGDAIVVIDGDLQDPPELIKLLVDRWRHGFEVVNAVRSVRHGETRFKRWTASAFYRLVKRWTDLDIAIDSGDYRLLSRRAADVITSMPENFRFLRGMAAWVGFTQTTISYERDIRYAGDSKYSLKRMMNLALNAFTGFSFVPLRLASLLGFTISIVCAVAIPIVVALRLSGVEGLGGQTTVLLAVLFFGGVQLTFLGVIGEYLGRIAIEVKRRPLYVVGSDTGTPVVTSDSRDHEGCDEHSQAESRKPP